MLNSKESKLDLEVRFGKHQEFSLKDTPLDETTLDGRRVIAAACYFLASPYEQFDIPSIRDAISGVAISGDLGRVLREHVLYLQNHPPGWDRSTRITCNPILVNGRSVQAFVEVGSAGKPEIFSCFYFGLYRDDNRMMNLPPQKVVVAHLT